MTTHTCSTCSFCSPLRTSFILYQIIDPQLAWSAVDSRTVLAFTATPLLKTFLIWMTRAIVQDLQLYIHVCNKCTVVQQSIYYFWHYLNLKLGLFELEIRAGILCTCGGQTVASTSYTVLPGCNNLWAFIKISKNVFYCISPLPSSHPSYPRTWRRTRCVVQGVTIADNGGQGTEQIQR